MTSRLADLARRPGTVISCRRMVAVVALAWKTEAMVPAARVRLNAIAAMTSQAALDANWPEGKCARAPDFRSAMACSTIAWARWGVGEHAVVAVVGEQLTLPVGD